ncbi:hypothetical protein [Brevundimonas diminuta]|uniref:hypothetical protein n=1 Tax=Brevundimonas diminuta TaxID=293 RepID=UPI0025A52CE8|nr:hypothetical protein [Brevundimonas diminuta]MDM8354003.1 hypothetical protein [Brevundimonas diminuta]
MLASSVEFGWYPNPLDFVAGDIIVSTLPDLEASVTSVREDDGVHNDWIGASPVSVIRNATLHESLFTDAPLGFALHGVGTNQNLPLEMEAVICRFLVALIGDPTADYVRAPVTTRMMQGWSP